ncbi:MAG TPA: carboxypeptidase-like regulatory domain-containing protein [Saprospiraceae bacterium]|nr:carboxypeptidase-like regulatory domain-containing protein [Saprospiraceae bacterium]
MSINLKSILFLTGIFLCSLGVAAQSGTVKGNIADGKSGDAMIGATIMLDGTTSGTTTDFDGNFELTQVAAGIYKVIISSIGYSNIIIENVRVEAGKETIINTKMNEESLVLDAVEVKAQRKTDTEVSVVSEIRQLANIAVGVSSQQITKTQDRDASQVVRRVPGVSIFDDRFIVVRGLNERYNTVLLNDVITPSTEVDVKSFSFDLIPSSAIDRMMVFKSPSADLPGDIAGGAIKIYTKTVPDGDNVSIGFTMGYRGNATGANVTDYQGSSLDGLGFGSSYRSLPSGFPSTKSVINNAATEAMIENFRNLNPYYSAKSKTINPDFRGNINLSKRFFIGKKELTTISYISYSNTNTYQNMIQNRFLFDESIQSTFRDNNYTNNVRLGAMSNWSLILNPKNKIEFRNVFNQLATKETVIRSGELFENNLEVANQSFRYEQKSILSSQLNGTHELNDKTRFKWIGGFGYTQRSEPDFRRFTSSRALGSEGAYKIDLQQFESPTLQQAARFWSNMDEFVLTATASVDRVIGTKHSDNDKNKVFKAGFYSEYKDRYFKARWFGIVNPNRVDASITSQTPVEFFNNDNLRSSRVFYSEGTNFDDKYTAQNILNAGYVSMYVPFTDKFNATFGLRGEYNQQLLQSRERGGGQKVDVDNAIFSPMPSLNATYKMNEKNYLRFGYGTTVNRPEFRELAPFTYYDFIFDVSRRGNKDIKVATIHNFDLRYDFYPSKGELITFGAFYKKFYNPIEAAVFYNGSTVAFTVANSESATSSGVELEVRKSVTENLMVLFNASVISSNVVVSGLNDFNRFLQGQSPYLINAGLFYTLPETGIQANVLYNIVGKRIYVIGDNVLSSNVFEMPRNVLDANISKTFGKVELKAGAQDILNQPFKLVQDTNRDNKITDSDGTFQEFKRGSNFYVSVNYKF